jgi:hypothetical protein
MDQEQQRAQGTGSDFVFRKYLPHYLGWFDGSSSSIKTINLMILWRIL